MFLLKIFVQLILTIGGASLWLGAQNSIQGADRTRKVESEVLKVERQWNNAFLHRDVRKLSRIMAKDYEATTSKGEVHDRAQELKDLKAATLRFVSFDTDEVVVRVYGSVAIVTGREHFSVLYEGQEVSGQFRYTRVYVERQRRWRLVASHTSKIGE